MKRLIKWLGIAATALVALLLVAAGVVYAASSSKINKHYTVGAAWARPAADSALVERGRHLTQAIAKCGDCHGENLGGTAFINSAAFARIPAPNITGGRGGALAAYSDEELARVIRHGVKRDGRAALIMPSESFVHLTEADLGALIAYLRTVPPVDSQWPAPRVGPIGRMMIVSGQPVMAASYIDHERRDVAPAAQPDTTAAYGRYLAVVGSCPVCHNPAMSGGASGGPPGSPIPANITPTGIGNWTEADFVRLLREGKGIGGRDIDNEFMPWQNMGRMTDAEIHALWLYLRSLPPKEIGER
jgi:mono/diheme cytochrome c family protein